MRNGIIITALLCVPLLNAQVVAPGRTAPATPSRPANQPEPPRAQPPAPGQEPPRSPNLPPGRATPILPPDGTYNITNNQGGVVNDPSVTTNASELPPANPNQFDTNRFNVATNRFPAINQTNAFSGRTQAVVLAMTNNLARMAPAQVTNIMQVQSSLTALQGAVVNFANVPNVQEVVQGYPQIQQQLVVLGSQIKALSRGSVQPSDAVVNRLSQDLLVVLLPRWQLTADRQLVLAMLINQAVNANGLTTAQIDATSANALVTLQGAGVPLSQAHLIGCDLHSIMAEVQPGG